MANVKNILSIKEANRLTPLRQGIVLLLCSSLVIVILNFLSANKEIEWIITISSIGLYAWINPIIGVFKDAWLRYLAQSFLIFIVISIVLFALSSTLSEINISQAPEYKLTFIATSIFFIVAYCVVAVLKGIVIFLSDK